MNTATVENPTSATASVVDPGSEPSEDGLPLTNEQIWEYGSTMLGDVGIFENYGGSPRFCDTNINEEIDLTLEELQHGFLPRNIKLIKDFGDLPCVETYPRLLNQVWTNLIINAAQSIGSSPGEVIVQTRVINNMIRVSVSDDGPGIPPECVSKIFDPFFTTKSSRDANGLGLSVSADIVRRHRGQINVINWPGEGVRFIVIIPVC